MPSKDAIIEWDVQNWSKALPFWEDFLPPNPSFSKVLAIGERNGGLSLWLASKGYVVICSDRKGPSEKARASHEKFEVSHLLEYKEIDVFNIPYEDNSFDVIICKSVIGGLKKKNDYSKRKTRIIENQKLAVEEIKRVLKPGGIFLGAENMCGSWFHQISRKIINRNKGWRYLSVKEIHFLFDQYSQIELRTYGFLPSHSITNSFSFFISKINRFLSAILPKEYLYIGFIAARKSSK